MTHDSFVSHMGHKTVARRLDVFGPRRFHLGLPSSATLSHTVSVPNQFGSNSAKSRARQCRNQTERPSRDSLIHPARISKALGQAGRLPYVAPAHGRDGLAFIERKPERMEQTLPGRLITVS